MRSNTNAETWLERHEAADIMLSVTAIGIGGSSAMITAILLGRPESVWVWYGISGLLIANALVLPGLLARAKRRNAPFAVTHRESVVAETPASLTVLFWLARYGLAVAAAALLIWGAVVLAAYLAN